MSALKWQGWLVALVFVAGLLVFAPLGLYVWAGGVPPARPAGAARDDVRITDCRIDPASRRVTATVEALNGFPVPGSYVVTVEFREAPPTGQAAPLPSGTPGSVIPPSGTGGSVIPPSGTGGSVIPPSGGPPSGTLPSGTLPSGTRASGPPRSGTRSSGAEGSGPLDTRAAGASDARAAGASDARATGAAPDAQAPGTPDARAAGALEAPVARGPQTLVKIPGVLAAATEHGEALGPVWPPATIPWCGIAAADFTPTP
ncbi:hypothetical protein [Streptomyces sp. NBC_00096]|uniref:hypothetical protein n=1 Tax=Streptomyces sp. NBC_00096 TaxID=2975650 RepID=UPI0032456CF3